MLKPTMSFQTFILIFISALCYAGWSMVARKAGNVSVSWINVLVCFSTLIPVLAVDASKLVGTTSQPASKSIAILLSAGLINGFGFVAWGNVISNTTVNLSDALPLLYGSMIVISAVGGYFIFNDQISWSKAFGLLGMVFCMWLITQ
jgi:drug/metabolite transporter (DMT)-like permease